MLDRVIYSVSKSALYLNQGKGDVKVTPCLLTPHDDPLSSEYRSKIMTFEGSEDDVLTRYNVAMKALNPDYLVRITSDSPLIPPFVITKHILTATKHGFDYTSNVDPDVRTCPDGWDTEVISKKLFNWCNDNATSNYDREHVTTLIRESPPDWARFAHLVAYGDFSQLKFSVDTEGDLEFVRGMYDIMERKLERAKKSAEGCFRI